jgi:amino acid adenylation domain-containing protein
MNTTTDRIFKLPPEQQAIRAKCFHSTGTFIEFTKDEVEQSIPERFEKIVAKYPERLAVKGGNRSLTYTALNQAANRIARTIVAKRGPGSEPIALLFEHGIDVVAAILGVLKAGKFYVAIDPSFPQERNSYMLEDSGASLIVTNNRNLHLGHNLINEVDAFLNIDEMEGSLSPDNLGCFASQHDIAYLVYTSGSTGRPRGVVDKHRNILYDVMRGINQIHVCTDDKLSLIHSVSFAAANRNLFDSLLSGASLFPFDIKSEGIHRLASWFQEEQITLCHLPLASFRQLTDLISGKDKLSSLRLVRLSGTPITKLDFDLYRQTFSSETLLGIGMGSTEAKWVCSSVLDHTFTFPKEGNPVGYPVAGQKVLLLDDNGHEVRPGMVGKIAVKSRYLTVGYWRRPDITQAKFLLDPSGGEERTCLTGDLGRMLPDGFLIHLGREDFMVKIRGYRIEITEIEHALLAHPRVKDAGVVAWDGEPGEKCLVAYVVSRAEAPPTTSELCDFIKEKLPDYMIPSAFVFLESLPLTNGKLDRAALPLPDNRRPDMRHPYVPPQTVQEERLVGIWENILNVSPIGIHDNFFDLGGHSLAATRVLTQIINKYQLEIPLRSLFEAPTIAQMAVVIEEHHAKKLEQNDLARILTELEALSEEDAQRVIATIMQNEVS